MESLKIPRWYGVPSWPISSAGKQKRKEKQIFGEKKVWFWRKTAECAKTTAFLFAMLNFQKVLNTRLDLELGFLKEKAFQKAFLTIQVITRRYAAAWHAAFSNYLWKVKKKKHWWMPGTIAQTNETNTTSKETLTITKNKKVMFSKRSKEHQSSMNEYHILWLCQSIHPESSSGKIAQEWTFPQQILVNAQKRALQKHNLLVM